MVEPRTPRPRGPGNSEEDIVAAAFASYRASSEEYFGPKLSASALMTRAAAARPRKRLLAISVAALACTGLFAAGVAVAQTVASNDPGSVGADGGDSGDDITGSDGTDGTIGSDGITPSTDPSSGPVEHELKTLVISLPDWPGDLAEDCPAGDYVFTPDPDTTAMPTGEVGESASPDGSVEPSKDPKQWELLPDGAVAMSTQLKPKDKDTVIVPVACGDAAGVIALKKTGDTFDTLGFVYAFKERSGAVTVAGVDGATVTLDFSARGDDEDVTKRQFAYIDGKFTEIDVSDEETAEPSSPSEDQQTTPSQEDPTATEPDPDDDSSTTKPHEDDNSPKAPD